MAVPQTWAVSSRSVRARVTRDVGEPALLGDAVVGHRRGEALEGLVREESQSCVVGPAEPGQALAVAAQVVREGRPGRRASPCRWGRRGPSRRRRACPGCAEWAGNDDSTSPGTATTSHSRPLAAWTVITWTASGRASTQPRSSPRSSSTAASSQARKPPSVGRSALAAKVGGDVGEGVEVGPGRARRVSPGGRAPRCRAPGPSRPRRPARPARAR